MYKGLKCINEPALLRLLQLVVGESLHCPYPDARLAIHSIVVVVVVGCWQLLHPTASLHLLGALEHLHNLGRLSEDPEITV